MPAKKSAPANKRPGRKKTGGKPTSLANLKIKAKEMGINGYSKMKKDELIWAIQEAEGNVACFSRIPDCGIAECLWRPECQPVQ